MSAVTTRRLRHYRTELALHELRGGPGRALLILHGLGDRSPSELPEWAASWPGPVHALDFTGHGESTVPVGGGYSAEILSADVDTALAELGEATVVGFGLGAYVALLIAGSRPAAVHGAILCDGPGTAGGPIGPTSQAFVRLAPSPHPPDPYALLELSHDLRPPDYATLFVRLAREGSSLPEPIAVTAVVRPPWLAAVADEMGVVVTSLTDALAMYAPR